MLPPRSRAGPELGGPGPLPFRARPPTERAARPRGHGARESGCVSEGASLTSVLDEALRSVRGALATTSGPDGVTFHRSPALGRGRLGDPAFNRSSSVP